MLQYVNVKSVQFKFYTADWLLCCTVAVKCSKNANKTWKNVPDSSPE